MISFIRIMMSLIEHRFFHQLCSGSNWYFSMFIKKSTMLHCLKWRVFLWERSRTTISNWPLGQALCTLNLPDSLLSPLFLTISTFINENLRDRGALQYELMEYRNIFIYLFCLPVMIKCPRKERRNQAVKLVYT